MAVDLNAIETKDKLNEEARGILLRAPAEVRILAEDAISRSRREGYEQGRAAALINLAWSRFYLSELEAAVVAGTEALDLYGKSDDLAGVSAAFCILGAVDHERGDYDRALDLCMKALELARSAERKDREAAALAMIGEVLKDAGEVREALDYFMRAAEAMKGGSDEFPMSAEQEANLFVNIGQAFLDLGETDNASGYLELGLGAAESNGDALAEIRAVKGLAVVARRKGDRILAAGLLGRALARSTSAGQILAGVETRIEQATLLIEQDEYRRAITVLDEAAAAAEVPGSKRKIADCMRLRSVALESLGEHSAALADFKRFHEAEEALSAERIAQGVKGAEVRFELERARQEAEIYRLRNVELKDRRADLERTNARLKAVSEIGRSVTASLKIEDVARTVHESVSRLMDAAGFCLAVLDPVAGTVEIRALSAEGRRLPPVIIPAEGRNCFAADVLGRNEALRVDDLAQEYPGYLNADPLTAGAHPSSLIYVPLSIGSRVVGAVGVQSPRRSAYNDDDVRLLSALGSFIAVAIENARAHEEVQRLNDELRLEKSSLERLARKVSRIANHDGLTGLPNRLLLGELLAKALSRAARSKKPVAVLFMDLDDFKPINDRFGHLAGDRSLVEVSKRLKAALRDSDVVARVGGDEFVAVAADVEGSEDAKLVAEKLSSAFDQPIVVNGFPCPVGVSIGISLYPEDGKTPDELLRKADEAMYRVKRGKKNGIAFYDEILQIAEGR